MKSLFIFIFLLFYCSATAQFFDNSTDPTSEEYQRELGTNPVYTDPPDQGEDGPPNSGEDPVPINQFVFTLVFFGVFYGCLTFKLKKVNNI